jgi:hypothetical protein
MVALACGCAGEVMVDDPRLLDEEEQETALAGEGSIRDGCESCAQGNCGWCAYEGSNVFRCRGDLPPNAGGICDQTGSVYNDEAGLYICWRCD